MRKVIHFLLALVVLCAGMSFVAQSDMEDAVMQQRMYCSNVYNKVWPDFDKTYATECDGDDIKKDSK